MRPVLYDLPAVKDTISPVACGTDGWVFIAEPEWFLSRNGVEHAFGSGDHAAARIPVVADDTAFGGREKARIQACALPGQENISWCYHNGLPMTGVPDEE